MENKKIILKSNEAYALITSAIAQNRVGEKLLTPSEVEELIYYYLEQEYKENLYSIRMTKDNENQQQIIIDQLRYGDIRVRLNNGNDLNIEIKSEKPYQELYKLRIDLLYREKYKLNESYDHKFKCKAGEQSKDLDEVLSSTAHRQDLLT